MNISRVSVAVVCGLIACDENVSRVPFLNILKVRQLVGKIETEKSFVRKFQTFSLKEG